MFERFTDRARRVLVLAQEECRFLRHQEIEPEHLLIGMLQEGEGTAAQVLASARISLSEVRETLITVVGQGVGTTPTTPPFTAASRKVLEHALAEAHELGHGYIGTEHLLLALTSDANDTAVDLLRRLGAEPEVLRSKVLELLSSADPLPVVHSDDVEMGATPPDPSDLLTVNDVEEVWRDHELVGLETSGTTNVDGVGHRWSSFQPLTLPTAWLAVTGGHVTVEAFDRFSSSVGPDLADPVEGVGDRATFNRRANALRVLSGSTVFVVRVTGGHGRSLELAVALARKVLRRLPVEES
jgi:hypothetical protein